MSHRFKCLRVALIIALTGTMVRAEEQTALSTRITVDHTASLEKLIADGNYAFADRATRTLTDIVSESGEGVTLTDIILFPIDKAMTSEQVLAALKEQGLRPATVRELLSLGVQNRGLQLMFPVVSLQAVTHVNQYAATLDRCQEPPHPRRCLVVSGADVEWPDFFRFAAVKK